MERSFLSDRVLRLVIGDITQVAADIIVNAANSALAGGGGVDGAIHRAGGLSIMEELREIRRRTGGCPSGSAVATQAGALPAQWIFHAVGPIYRGGDDGEAELLASCYRTCLRMAEEKSAKSISFPSISTGAYAYPMDDAAGIALEVTSAHLEQSETRLREIVFVLFDRRAYDVFAAQLAARFQIREN